MQIYFHEIKIKWYFWWYSIMQKYFSNYYTFVFFKHGCWNGLWRYEKSVGIDNWWQDASLEYFIARFTITMSPYVVINANNMLHFLSISPNTLSFGEWRGFEVLGWRKVSKGLVLCMLFQSLLIIDEKVWKRFKYVLIKFTSVNL